ncbi:hypothetical protein V8C44DRAFT_345002 [Trichoderma aethiopicum]
MLSSLYPQLVLTLQGLHQLLLGYTQARSLLVDFLNSVYIDTETLPSYTQILGFFSHGWVEVVVVQVIRGQLRLSPTISLQP